MGELKEALAGMDKLPEIVVGQQGAVEVARHPDAVSTVTGIVGQQAHIVWHSIIRVLYHLTPCITTGKLWLLSSQT